MGAVPRQSCLGPAAGFLGVVACHSWPRSLWVQYPANRGWGLLLVFSGWSFAIPGWGPCGCSSLPVLARVCWFSRSGSLPILDEVPMGAVPRQSWPGAAAGFLGVVRRHSWLSPLWVQCPANSRWGLLLSLSGVVPHHSWLRSLWVQFPASLGLGLVLCLLGVVPRHSWLRSLWVQVPGSLGWGLQFSLLGLDPRQFWVTSLRCVGGVCVGVVVHGALGTFGAHGRLRATPLATNSPLEAPKGGRG